jgi:hypothetical protein
MLAVAVLVAGLFGAPRHAGPPPGAGCPAVPVAAFVTTATSCPALEISGRVDATGATLDPAFDVSAAPADLARIADGDAVLTGYAADGRTLFSLPVPARGAFHIYVPLGTAAQELVDRLTLSTETTFAERTSSPVADLAAEIISLSEQRVIVAWNAHAFPAIRVYERQGDRTPAGTGAGSSTFEQTTIDTRARRLYITFSNGVRSLTREFSIFGR